MVLTEANITGVQNSNILTSSKGIMKTSADYSLGKKSLLGQVV